MVETRFDSHNPIHQTRIHIDLACLSPYHNSIPSLLLKDADILTVASSGEIRQTRKNFKSSNRRHRANLDGFVIRIPHPEPQATSSILEQMTIIPSPHQRPPPSSYMLSVVTPCPANAFPSTHLHITSGLSDVQLTSLD